METALHANARRSDQALSTEPENARGNYNVHVADCKALISTRLTLDGDVGSTGSIKYELCGPDGELHSTLPL